MTIAAQACAKWNSAACCEMYTPRASREPPKYSLTIAPITLNVLPTFRALKT